MATKVILICSHMAMLSLSPAKLSFTRTLSLVLFFLDMLAPWLSGRQCRSVTLCLILYIHNDQRTYFADVGLAAP